MIPFQEFPKIARLNREVIVTEKIDGTNGQVLIRPAFIEDGGWDDRYSNHPFEYGYDCHINIPYSDGSTRTYPGYIRAGSRSRWVPNVGGDDNNGFGRWVYQHAHELAALGFGAHFGEWWGQGIQRKYGLSEKRWSLFNVSRWRDSHEPFAVPLPPGQSLAPACCHVVPTLMIGTPSQGLTVQHPALELLRANGSFAAPGFMKPEGIVLFHTASYQLFKVTLERDAEWKGKSAQ